jgi:hypothetical protein
MATGDGIHKGSIISGLSTTASRKLRHRLAYAIDRAEDSDVACVSTYEHRDITLKSGLGVDEFAVSWFMDSKRTS